MGFLGAGFLQGFGQAYNQAYQHRVQQQLDQRHQLAQTFMTLYPNMNHDAQRDAAERMLQIYSLPPGKEVPKQVGDITTLGQKYSQMRQQVGAPQPGQQPPQAQGPPISPQGTATSSGGMPITNAGPANMTQAPAIPPPPAYSPFMNPDEKNKLEAAHSAAITSGQRQGIADTFNKLYEGFVKSGMDPQQAAMNAHMASGGNVVGGMFMPRTLNRIPVSGADILNDDPNAVTLGGQSPSREGFYTQENIGGRNVWAPAGLGATQIQANIAAKQGQYPTSNWNAFRIAYAEQHPEQTPEQQLSGAVTEYNTHNSHGFRMVPQKNGDTLMVPVETSTGRGSLGGQASSGGIPAPPGGKSAQTTGAGGVKGTVVGGKYPEEVQKQMVVYQSAITRYNVMSEALPKALAGDQQAMINLLYNHIGMTTGLQKGARITRDIIEEAQHSAPWEATLLARIGVGNEFTMTPDLLRGVALPPQEMHQMIGQAEDRVGQEYDQLKSLQDQYAGGAPPTPENVIKGGRQAQAGGKIPPRTSSTPPPANKSQGGGKAQVFHYDAQGNRVQ